MPDFQTEISIDPWEYVQECRKAEIKELIQVLKDEGHLSGPFRVSQAGQEDNLMDITYENALGKLQDKRIYLTLEEEQFIINLSNKY